MNRPYYKRENTSWSIYFKYLVVFIVIFIPLVLVYTVFSPFAGRKVVKEINQKYDQYVLPAQFSEKDVKNLIEKIKKDSEFGFYFYALKPEQINQAVQEVYQTLDQNRGEEKLLQLIQTQKQKIQNISQLFYYLDYTESYINNPHSYPELDQVLWEFMQEEFKLTFIGIVYKANFNRNFVFSWNTSTQRSAEKLRRLIFALKSKQPPKQS